MRRLRRDPAGALRARALGDLLGGRLTPPQAASLGIDLAAPELAAVCAAWYQAREAGADAAEQEEGLAALVLRRAAGGDVS